MIATVTQEDIDAGVRCDRSRCPIARAAARALAVPQVWADGYGIRTAIHDDAQWQFSESTRKRMSHYDNTGQMRPFAFRLTRRVF